MTYKRDVKKIIYAIILLMFLVFPTSINRNVFSVEIIIALWGFQSVLILLLAFLDKVSTGQILVSFVCILCLSVATMVSSSESLLYISLARIAPIICFLVICCLHVCDNIEFAFFSRLLDVACVLIIIWNLLTLLRIDWFIEFVNCFYTQLDTYTATYWSLVNNKPIFTFGVHNFAAVFYMHFFLFCFCAYRQTNKKRYILYMLSLYMFTLLLKSSSGIGIFGIMTLFICSLFINRLDKLLLTVVCISTMLLCIFQTSIGVEYITSLTSKANGFIARYSSESSLYEGNFNILNRFPMGIGFQIGKPDLGLYFADSGFIIYYTMGGGLILALFLGLIFNYYKKNLGLKMALVLFLVVLLTELSLVSFMYNKTLYLYIFEVAFYKSLYSKKIGEYDIKQGGI